MKESNHQKGYRRDNEIVAIIEKQKVLNTDQLKLLFPDTSERMLYRRLQRLTERRMIGRDRLSFSEPNFFYKGKKPGQVEHSLAVSWVYVWLLANLKSWEKMHSFERETSYRILRTDGFAAIKNVWENKFRFCFVEADLSDNPFDKIAKYNTLFASEGYIGSWWVPLADRFPPVIVVTAGREKQIRDIIKAENVNNLEFQVYSLNQIKEGCIWHRQQRKLSALGSPGS
jgi:DNA-binding HxlR family transcriptional regulator